MSDREKVFYTLTAFFYVMMVSVMLFLTIKTIVTLSKNSSSKIDLKPPVYLDTFAKTALKKCFSDNNTVIVITKESKLSSDCPAVRVVSFSAVGPKKSIFDGLKCLKKTGVDFQITEATLTKADNLYNLTAKGKMALTNFIVPSTMCRSIK